MFGSPAIKNSSIGGELVRLGKRIDRIRQQRRDIVIDVPKGGKRIAATSRRDDRTTRAKSWLKILPRVRRSNRNSQRAPQPGDGSVRFGQLTRSPRGVSIAPPANWLQFAPTGHVVGTKNRGKTSSRVVDTVFGVRYKRGFPNGSGSWPRDGIKRVWGQQLGLVAPLGFIPCPTTGCRQKFRSQG